MAKRFQLLASAFKPGSLLNQNAAAKCHHKRQANRFSRGKTKINHSDDSARGLDRNGPAARCANGQKGLAIRVKHDRRRHRAARAFAAFDAIGNQLPFSFWPSSFRNTAEISEFIVEIKAARHQPRSKRPFDGRGVADECAMRPRNGEMRCAALLAFDGWQPGLRRALRRAGG